VTPEAQHRRNALQRARRRARKAASLCACGKAPIVSSGQCVKCRAYSASIAAKTYRRKKDEHECLKCGDRALPFGPHCERHTASVSASDHVRYRRRMEASACAKCGHAPRVVGGSRCEKCIAKQKALWASRRGCGECVRCGRHAVGEKALCRWCARKRWARWVARCDRLRVCREETCQKSLDEITIKHGWCEEHGEKAIHWWRVRSQVVTP